LVCFSPQADLVGGLVIGAIGVDAVAHVGDRQEHMALAALPLLFAVHQLDEAVIWWAVQGRVSRDVGRAATWVYVLIAYVLLPLLVPIIVLSIEQRRRRRFLLFPLVVVGALVSVAFFIGAVRGPMGVSAGHLHLSYRVGGDSGVLIDVLYVVVTCGAMLLSSYRHVVFFGVVNLIAVMILGRLAADGYASLWCAWAAITSAGIAAHIRLTARRPILEGSRFPSYSG
jgi:hypothetical protein